MKVISGRCAGSEVRRRTIYKDSLPVEAIKSSGRHLSCESTCQDCSCGTFFVPAAGCLSFEQASLTKGSS